MTAARPLMSVIVASYNSGATLGRCLESLQRQTWRDFEVLVVDSSPDDSATLAAAPFPEVRLIHLSGRRFPGAARNIGIAEAASDLIAFLDADAVADPDWARKLWTAHHDPYPLIGGAVSNANPESAVSWAAYLCEFSIWLPAGRTRTMVDVPTCSVSLKRWLFEKCGPFRETGYCSDTVFNWRAGAAGFPPRFLPSVRVSHINIDERARFLRKMRMHGEAFGRVRVAERLLSRPAAALLAFGTPLLPLFLYARILRRVLRAPSFAWPLLRATPLILLGLAAWSWGEAVAYWTHVVPRSRFD